MALLGDELADLGIKASAARMVESTPGLLVGILKNLLSETRDLKVKRTFDVIYSDKLRHDMHDMTR